LRRTKRKKEKQWKKQHLSSGLTTGFHLLFTHTNKSKKERKWDLEKEKKEISFSTFFSLWQTFVNLFRGSIGSGILGQPYAFLQGGLWVLCCLCFKGV
jgi:hypothetical protein